MSFTPNIGVGTRAVYVAFGAVLIGLAIWGPMPGPSWRVIVALMGLGGIVEGAIGF